MGRIPKYTSEVLPEVTPPRRFNARAHPDMFTTPGLGEAAQAMRDVAGALRVREERDDRTSALDAYNKLRDQASLKLHGDGTDENPGLYSLQGEELREAHQRAQEELREALEAQAAELPNRRARDLYMANASSYMSGELGRFNAWRGQRLETWRNEVHNAALEGDARDMYSSWDQPDAVAHGIMSIQERTLAHAGVDLEADSIPQIHRENARENAARALVGVMDEAIKARRYDLAERYLTDYDTILGPQRAGQLRRVIEEKKQREEVFDTVDQIFAPRPDGEITPLGEALSAVREKYKDNPEVRQQAVSIVKARHVEEKKVEQDVQESQFNDFLEQFMTAGATLDTYDAATKLPAGLRSQAYEMISDAQDVKKSDPEVWAAWHVLTDLDKAQASPAAIMNLRSNLTNADWRKVLAEHNAAKRGETTSPVHAHALKTLEAYIDGTPVAGYTASEQAVERNRLKALAIDALWLGVQSDDIEKMPRERIGLWVKELLERVMAEEPKKPGGVPPDAQYDPRTQTWAHPDDRNLRWKPDGSTWRFQAKEESDAARDLIFGQMKFGLPEEVAEDIVDELPPAPPATPAKEPRIPGAWPKYHHKTPPPIVIEDESPEQPTPPKSDLERVIQREAAEVKAKRDADRTEQWLEDSGVPPGLSPLEKVLRREAIEAKRRKEEEEKKKRQSKAQQNKKIERPNGETFERP